MGDPSAAPCAVMDFTPRTLGHLVGPVSVGERSVAQRCTVNRSSGMPSPHFGRGEYDAHKSAPDLPPV
jgi:hypothetical protein